MSNYSLIPERAISTLLVWSLILEIIIIAYFCSSSQTGKFEFTYTLFLLLITILSLAFMIVRLVRRTHKLRTFRY